MPPWTLSRDVRRTAKTLMQRAGVRPDISERVLAHVIPGVEGTYDRYEYLPQKRDALKELWGVGCPTSWKRLSGNLYVALPLRTHSSRRCPRDATPSAWAKQRKDEKHNVNRARGRLAPRAHIKTRARGEHSRLNCSVPWVDRPVGFRRGRRDRCPIRT
jgi:hypothetical protein